MVPQRENHSGVHRDLNLSLLDLPDKRFRYVFLDLVTGYSTF